MTQDELVAAHRELARSGWEMQPDQGFIELVGPLWRFKSQDVERYCFWAAKQHRNRRGVVQGGMLMTLADRALGATARKNDPAVSQATVQMSMSFLAPAQTNAVVEITCQIDRATRSLVFVSGQMCQGDRMIGTASGVWKILGK